jgi:hypothetical protein
MFDEKLYHLRMNQTSVDFKFWDEDLVVNCSTKIINFILLVMVRNYIYYYFLRFIKKWSYRVKF